MKHFINMLTREKELAEANGQEAMVLNMKAAIHAYAVSQRETIQTAIAV